MTQRRPHTRRNGVTVLLLGAVVAGMVGLSFASAPLYRLFCAATGYGGTTQRAAAAPARPAAGLVTVRFNAETAPGLAWDFHPLVGEVRLHAGEQREVFFRVTNRGAETIVGSATFNVTPTKAGIYFDKLQCFCFTEQRLKPGETRDMGVSFFVDPDLLTDPDTRDVRTITLSYTMFPSHRPDRPSAAATAYATPGRPAPAAVTFASKADTR